MTAGLTSLRLAIDGAILGLGDLQLESDAGQGAIMGDGFGFTSLSEPAITDCELEPKDSQNRGNQELTPKLKSPDAVCRSILVLTVLQRDACILSIKYFSGVRSSMGT